MSKLAILALALFALIALDQASAFRTAITTTVDKETAAANPRGESQQQSCREQFQQQQQLRDCQRYMAQQAQRFANPKRREQGLDECCDQLEKMDQDCQCENLREAIRQKQQQEGEMREEEKRKMEQAAEDLPRRCGFSSQRCQIEANWF
ncbi:hypothetical protein CsSME_00018354 [Camellia sinensis var. sinensis]